MSKESLAALHAKLRKNLEARHKKQIADGTYVSPEEIIKARTDRLQAEIEASKTPEARELRQIVLLLSECEDYSLDWEAKDAGFVTEFEVAFGQEWWNCIRHLDYKDLPLRGRYNYHWGKFFDLKMKIWGNEDFLREFAERNYWRGIPVDKVLANYREARERLEKLAEKALGDRRVVPRTPETNELGTFEVGTKGMYYGAPDYRKIDGQKLRTVPGIWRAYTTTDVDHFEHHSEGYYTKELLVVLEGFDITGKPWKNRKDTSYDKCFGFFCATGHPECDEFDEEMVSLWLDNTFGGDLHSNGRGVVCTANVDHHKVKVIRNEKGQVCAAKIVFKLKRTAVGFK